MTTITKQPAEQYPVAWDYYGRLPFNARLVSGVASALDITVPASPVDATSTICQSTIALISGTQALVGIKGGTTARTYKLTLRVILSDNSVLEDEAIISVTEL